MPSMGGTSERSHKAAADEVKAKGKFLLWADGLILGSRTLTKGLLLFASSGKEKSLQTAQESQQKSEEKAPNADHRAERFD